MTGPLLIFILSILGCTLRFHTEGIGTAGIGTAGISAPGMIRIGASASIMTGTALGTAVDGMTLGTVRTTILGMALDSGTALIMVLIRDRIPAIIREYFLEADLIIRIMDTVTDIMVRATEPSLFAAVT